MLNEAPEQPKTLQQQLQAQQKKLKPAGNRVLNEAPEQQETLQQQLQA